MTWEDLPEGLVDNFRQEAFSLHGEGVIIVRVEQGRFWVKSFREPFLAHLYDRLNEFITSHTKADVLVMTGRTDKSGERKEPIIQIREFLR